MVIKSLKINSIINIIKTILGLIFPLITFPYASRILGVENIGKLNYANSIVNYFVLFAGLGISTYAIREGAKIRDESEKINQFASEIIIINTISTVTVGLILIVVTFLPGLKEYQNLLLLYGTTIIFNLIGINWLFNIFEDYLYITLRTVLFQIVSLILLFLLVKNKEDYMLYAAITVLSNVGSNVYNMIYGRRYISLFGKRKRYNLRQHLKPIFIIFGMSVASTIYLNMDMTMIGAIRGDKEVGIYTAATKISRIIGQLITSACAVLIPRLSYYIEKKELTRYRELIFDSINYILFLSIPSSIGLGLLAPEIIKIFSGTEFMDAVVTMRILCPNIVFSVLNGFLAYQIFMPMKKEKEILFATIGGAIANAVLNIVLINNWGHQGAAIATLCSELIVFIICIKYMQDFYKDMELFREVWKYILGSTVVLMIGNIIRCLKLTLYLHIIITISICIISYILVLSLLRASVLNSFFRFIKKLLRK